MKMFAPVQNSGYRPTTHASSQQAQQPLFFQPKLSDKNPDSGQQTNSVTVQREKKGDVETDRFNDPKAAAFVSKEYIAAFKTALGKIQKLEDASAAIRQHGEQLWTSNHASKLGGDTDDRPLYWTRLAALQEIEQWKPAFLGLDQKRESLKQLFEQTSRGQNTILYKDKKGVRKILISGFDPFNLKSDVEVSNPSGRIALSLDGLVIEKDGIKAEIQSTVFPNRYASFDARIVEQVFTPYLSGEQAVDMILSIGLANNNFEVEGFAGKRRSVGDHYPDNMNVGGGTLSNPVAFPNISKDAPEFLPTGFSTATLKSMRETLGRDKAQPYESTVKEIPTGKTEYKESEQPSADSMAVEGSGGGFFCNEMMYRTLLLRNDLGSSVPTGFLHIPKSSGQNTNEQIIGTIINILKNALPTLGSPDPKTD